MFSNFHFQDLSPKKHQIAPFLQICWQQEPDAWKRQLRQYADDRTPGGEVVDTDQRVCPLAYPSDGGICSYRPTNAHKRNPNSTESLCWCHVVVVGSVGNIHLGTIRARHHITISTGRWRCGREREERSWSCDEHHTHQRDQTSNLFDASEGLFDQNRASPTRQTRRKESNDSCICEWKVEQRI